MVEIDLTKQRFSNDRAMFRKEIINLFLDEKPGTGKGEKTTRYKYIVRILTSGKKVYLSRPANLNNGFDFTLNVENTNFNQGKKNKEGKAKRSRSRPTHEDILTDLKNKKIENIAHYNFLIAQITLIFNCQQPNKQNLIFKTGHPSELLLECIKWLFIEQDVTYWNYSGRLMFYNKIKGI
jgi:hypothetical protein